MSRVRSPWKASVRGQNAVNLPAAKRLADKVVSIAEDRQVPQTRDIEIVSHVKIGRTTFLTQVLWKRLIGFCARTFVRKRVDTLGPTIKNIKLETPCEATCQSRVHRVVV